MYIKGTAVASIPTFVKKKFGDRYDEWLNSLSPQSQKIMKRYLVSKWYPVEYAIIEPTEHICRLFYNGDKRGAWEAGRFSAENALKGIYKFFVKLGSPGFIIKRATNIFSFYYKEARMKVIENEEHRTVVHIYELKPPSQILEARIAGWMERSLEISGCEYVNIQIIKSPTTIVRFLSEYKLRQIITEFCLDTSASKASIRLKINRNTCGIW